MKSRRRVGERRGKEGGGVWEGAEKEKAREN